MISVIFIVAGAGIVLVAGTLHLHSTFFGSDLRPADTALKVRMAVVPLNVSERTSTWRTWIGFNATMSLGLILFGLVFGYLALFELAVLRRTPFLPLLGIVFLAGGCATFARFTYYLPAAVFGVALALFATGSAALALPMG